MTENKSICLSGMLVILLASTATGNEPIRFGKSSGFDTIATRPQRSLRETLVLPEKINALSQGNAQATMSVPATTVRVGRPVNEDQRNWIFQDTRSAEGMQRAMGVGDPPEESTTVADRDSTMIIQEYFDRQQARPTTQNPSAGLTGGLQGLGSGAGSQPGFAPNDPFASQNPQTTSDPGRLFGVDAFQSTLNSDNLAVRRAFRNQFYSQDSLAPSGLSAQQNAISPTSNPLLPESPSSLGNGNNRSQSLSELAARASLIESLAPTSPSFGPALAPAPAATRAPGSPPTIDDKPLYDRRGGLIEIPGRKF